MKSAISDPNITNQVVFFFVCFTMYQTDWERYLKTLAVNAQPTNPVLADGSWRKRISKGMKPSLPKSMVWISLRSFQSQTLSDLPYNPMCKTVNEFIRESTESFDNRNQLSNVRQRLGKYHMASVVTSLTRNINVTIINMYLDPSLMNYIGWLPRITINRWPFQ